MTPEQIEATRPAFEAWYSEQGEYPHTVALNLHGDYPGIEARVSWRAWQAAKADTLAQADHPEVELDMVEPVRLSAAEVYMFWSRGNGLEDADMCKLSDFDRVVRVIEAALHAKGHAPAAEILARMNYHFRPGKDGEPDDFDLYPLDVECKGCIPVLIVRAAPLTA